MRMKFVKTLFVYSLLFLAQNTFTQDFMMQGWYWDFPKGACGASNNWAVTLNSQTAQLGTAGFTYMWLPPSSRASFGSCSNGYDPKDLYDLGEYGLGATGLGTRAELDVLISSLSSNGINAVADVVYNHRDGGDWEVNPAVKTYMTTYPGSCGSASPYPVNGKLRMVLPLGGSSGNNAGDYYFKFSSASGLGGFNGKDYKLYFETNTVGWQSAADQSESEPNGGGDCGEPNNTISLGINMLAVEEIGACNTDEFYLNLGASDFDAAGDNLYIYLEEVGGGGTGIDIRPYGIWSAGSASDIIAQLDYETRTDFTAMPSAQGGMNYLNFKPNGTVPTCMTGDWDFPYFFNDIEEDESSTANVYGDWSKWLWNDVGYRGYRLDAVKHFDPLLVDQILSELASNGITPGMFVGEIFDTNAGTLTAWVNSVTPPAGVNVRAFDFALRQSLKDASDQFGYDVRNVFNSGMVDGGTGATGFNAVTFVNNHDYRSAGEPVLNDPMLAYAYILTNNKVGLPCVFYPDYFGATVPNYPTVNLSSQIDELIEVHKNYIFQSSGHDYLSRFGTPYSSTYSEGAPNTTLFYQLSGGVGGKEVLVAINYSGTNLTMDHGVNLSNGETVTAIAGSSSELSTVISSGQMHVELPPRSYAVWVNCPPEDLGLPLNLLSFEITKAIENRVELQWKTSAEINTSHFEIERSTDGIDFRPIGSVEAKNSPGLHGYQFTDINRPSEKVYYRLKMVDLDGSYEYSEILLTKYTRGQIKLYPNPSTGVYNIEGLSNGDYQVFDLRGKQIYSGQSPTIDLTNQEKGVYILKSEEVILRLIKL